MELRHFPDELLDQICSHLSGVNLTCFALSCRRVHRVAEPHLYSHFNQDTSYANHRLVRILAEPYLARHVKHLMACDHNHCFRPIFPEFPSLPADRWERIRETLHKFISRTSESSGVDLLPLWMLALNKITRNTWDAATAFLLVLFKNLESFEVAHWSRNQARYPFLERVFIRARRQDDRECAILTKLNTMNLLSDDHSHLEATDILTYLQLQSLDNVYIRDAMIFGHPKHSRMLPTTKLRISVSAWMTFDNIRNFLRCFDSLRTFELEQNSSSDVFDPIQARVAAILFDALMPSRDSLEELIFTYAHGESHQEPYDGPLDGIVRPWYVFEKLKVLRGDVRILLGYADVQMPSKYTHVQVCDLFASLPPLLKSLRLMHCDLSLHSNLLRVFSEEGAKHLPHLRNVELLFNEGFFHPDCVASNDHLSKENDTLSQNSIVKIFEVNQFGLQRISLPASARRWDDR